MRCILPAGRPAAGCLPTSRRHRTPPWRQVNTLVRLGLGPYLSVPPARRAAAASAVENKTL